MDGGLKRQCLAEGCGGLGGPDSLSIGAAKPQEVLHAMQNPSCACGTPIAELSGPPACLISLPFPFGRGAGGEGGSGRPKKQEQEQQKKLSKGHSIYPRRHYLPQIWWLSPFPFPFPFFPFDKLDTRQSVMSPFQLWTSAFANPRRVGNTVHLMVESSCASA